MTKKFFLKSMLLSLMIMACFFAMSFAFANTPIEYNLVPLQKSNSVIDTSVQKELLFRLNDDTSPVYFNGFKLIPVDKIVKVDISNISGYKSLSFYDDNNNSVSFNYYFSSVDGKLEDYVLVQGKELNVYVTTFKNIKIIYSDKDKNKVKNLENYILKLPENVLVNLNEIKMIPYSNTANIAGTTKNGVITLYNFGKYSNTTQMNIIFHEIAHTWANNLMDKKILDYSYTDYQEVVAKDNNFISTYAKNFADDHSGKLSEDFADSVAFYFINEKSFMKSYKNRAMYIEELLKR